MADVVLAHAPRAINIALLNVSTGCYHNLHAGIANLSVATCNNAEILGNLTVCGMVTGTFPAGGITEPLTLTSATPLVFSNAAPVVSFTGGALSITGTGTLTTGATAGTAIGDSTSVGITAPAVAVTAGTLTTTTTGGVTMGDSTSVDVTAPAITATATTGALVLAASAGAASLGAATTLNLGGASGTAVSDSTSVTVTAPAVTATASTGALDLVATAGAASLSAGTTVTIQGGTGTTIDDTTGVTITSGGNVVIGGNVGAPISGVVTLDAGGTGVNNMCCFDVTQGSGGDYTVTLPPLVTATLGTRYIFYLVATGTDNVALAAPMGALNGCIVFNTGGPTPVAASSTVTFVASDAQVGDYVEFVYSSLSSIFVRGATSNATGIAVS